MSRRAKIVGTIGPASAGRPVIDHLVAAGLGRGPAQHEPRHPGRPAAAYRAVRAAADEARRSVGVLVDLQGPKIRLGTFASGPVQLTVGAEFTITGEDVPGDAPRPRPPTRAWPPTSGRASRSWSTTAAWCSR